MPRHSKRDTLETLIFVVWILVVVLTLLAASGACSSGVREVRVCENGDCARALDSMRRGIDSVEKLRDSLRNQNIPRHALAVRWVAR